MIEKATQNRFVGRLAMATVLLVAARLAAFLGPSAVRWLLVFLLLVGGLGFFASALPRPLRVWFMVSIIVLPMGWWVIRPDLLGRVDLYMRNLSDRDRSVDLVPTLFPLGYPRRAFTNDLLTAGWLTQDGKTFGKQGYDGPIIGLVCGISWRVEADFQNDTLIGARGVVQSSCL